VYDTTTVTEQFVII